MKKSNWVFIVLIMLLVHIFSGCPDPTDLNKAPVIESVSANPATVTLGSESTLSVLANDADGDTLAISWAASAGSFNSTSGSPVIWSAPNSAGIYMITVTVSDSINPSVTETTAVTVELLSTSVTNFVAQGESEAVSLTWTNPNASNYQTTILRRSTDLPPALPTLGTEVYVGTNEFFLDENLTNSETYYYSIWSRNTSGDYSERTTATAIPDINANNPIAIYKVGGTISGLDGEGLQLALNGTQKLNIEPGQTAFEFPNGLSNGTGYNVTISEQPVTGSQIASVSNESGIISNSNISNVEVTLVFDAARLFTRESTSIIASNTFYDFEPIVNDFDQDGDLDIVTSSLNDSRYYRNDGNALFNNIVSAGFPLGSNGYFGFDADGDEDIDVLFYDSDSTQLFLNSLGTFTEKINHTLPENIHYARAANLDGDDYSDIVLIDITSREIKIFLNDGYGVFSEKTVTNISLPSEYSANQVFLYDFSGDGDTDIYYSAEKSDINYGPAGKSGLSRLLENSGDASFTEDSILSGDFMDFYPVHGDFDGNGFKDFYFIGDYNYNSGVIRTYATHSMWFQVSKGSYVSTTPDFFATASRSGAAPTFQVADFDSDGDLDVLGADAYFFNGSTSGINRLYFNDGFGNFPTYAASYFPGATGNLFSAAADFDNDNDIDLIFGGLIPDSGNGQHYYENNIR